MQVINKNDILGLIIVLSFSIFSSVHASTLCDNKTLTRMTKYSLTDFNINRPIFSHETDMLADLYEPLTYLSDSTDVTPGAAESWEISSDQLKYTFHLRKNAKWSDATPVTAHDFVRTVKRNVLDSEHGATIYADIYGINNLLENPKLENDKFGVIAVDDYTLEINLSHWTPLFLQRTASYDWYPTHSNNYGQSTSLSKELRFNGAYVPSDFTQSEQLKLIKNEYYYNIDNVYFNCVNYFTKEHAPKTIHAIVKDGEPIISFFEDDKSIDWFKEFAPYHIKNKLSATLYYLDINFNLEKFKPLDVRKAMDLAIDREHFVKYVLRQTEGIQDTWISPSIYPEGKNSLLDVDDLSYVERTQQARSSAIPGQHIKSNRCYRVKSAGA